MVWSSAHLQTGILVEELGALALELEGRLLVLSADVATDPMLMQVFQPLLTQAFGQAAVPATFGVLQGQPIPLFPGVPAQDQVRTAIDQLLQAAVQSGIAGRVEYTAVDAWGRFSCFNAPTGWTSPLRAQQPRRHRRTLTRPAWLPTWISWAVMSRMPSAAFST